MPPRPPSATDFHPKKKWREDHFHDLINPLVHCFFFTTRFSSEQNGPLQLDFSTFLMPPVNSLLLLIHQAAKFFQL